ncbi:MAG: DUF3047 domain-containing protein [Myxococcota bacterium]
MRKKILFSSIILLLSISVINAAESRHRVNVKVPIDLEWKRLPQYSGPDIYYKILIEDGITFLRAEFKPEYKTTIFYRKLPRIPKRYKHLKFKWRVYKFPEGADETVEGRMDAAASVYLFFKDGLKKYVIKYIFSVAHKKGFNFRSDDSNFINKLHIVVLEDRFNEVGKWLEEEIDFYNDFKRYFEKEEVPQLMGIGILSDGDGTKKEVVADYADFTFIDTGIGCETEEEENTE